MIHWYNNMPSGSLIAAHRTTATERVEAHIRELIDRGELGGGSLLPSERDVAQSLGVARGTVRRAIGRMVSAGMLVSASRQGTLVRQTARPRSADSFWAIIVPYVDYFYPELVDAVENEAGRLGKRVMLACSRDDLQKERQLIDEQVTQGAGGILLAPAVSRHGEPHRNELGDLAVPMVLLDHQEHELPDADVVLSDNFAGAYDVTVHLIQAGRKRIAMVPSSVSTPQARERTAGYRAALADNGLSPEAPAFSALDVREARVEKIQAAVDGGADAFVALNDHTACMLLRHLAKLQVSVPSQVAVVGYDDEPIARFADPPLTTVRVDKAKMARRAVRMLSDRIESGRPGRYRRQVIRPALVVRSSCGGTGRADVYAASTGQLPSAVRSGGAVAL